MYENTTSQSAAAKTAPFVATDGDRRGNYRSGLRQFLSAAAFLPVFSYVMF